MPTTQLKDILTYATNLVQNDTSNKATAQFLCNLTKKLCDVETIWTLPETANLIQALFFSIIGEKCLHSKGRF